MITRRRGDAESLNEVSGAIVDAALAIHRELGPGLLETVYEVVLANELRERGLPVHSKQLLTYLKLMNLEVGLLINFGSATLKEGLHRIVNNFSGSKPNSNSSPRLRASA